MTLSSIILSSLKSHFPEPKSPLETELKAWCDEVIGTSEYRRREGASEKIFRSALNPGYSLDLAGWQLTSIPSSISSLKLEFLNLSNNQLSSLPESLGDCSDLKILDVSNNNLAFLPESIGLCFKLDEINVSNNKLSLLPHSLIRCLALRTVLAANNRIAKPPEYLGKLPLLKVLDLTHNPLREPLPEWFTKLAARVEISVDPVKPPFIPAYDMCKSLGFATTPKVIRASHRSARIFGPKISELLKKLGASVTDLDIHFHNIDPALLGAEVRLGIEEIRKTGLKASVLMQLLQRATPSSLIGKIRDTAARALSNYQGLVLPGGANIEPEFYRPEQPLEQNGDYRRTIAESALISAADRSKIPIFGTCRGAQILNVYFGGTLKDVDRQLGFQSIELSEGELVTAYANHTQACDQIADRFRPVGYSSRIPKVLISKDGLMIGTQVHPELDLDGEYSSLIKIYELFFRAMRPEAVRSNL